MSITSERVLWETAEARKLMYGFVMNNRSTEWLNCAMAKIDKVYGNGANGRILAIMRNMLKEQNETDN